MFFSSQDERVLYTVHASPAITTKSLQELFVNEHPADIQAYHECTFWGNISTTGTAFDDTTYGVTFPTVAAAKRAFALHNWRPVPTDTTSQLTTQFPICLSTRPLTSVFPPTPTARPRNVFTERAGYGERVLYELLKEFGDISFLCISSHGSVVLFEREEDALAAEAGIHEVAPGLSLRVYDAIGVLFSNLQPGKEEENVRSLVLSSRINKVTTLYDGVAVAEFSDAAEATKAIKSPRSPICPKAIMSFYLPEFHPPLTQEAARPFQPPPLPYSEIEDLRAAARELEETKQRCAQLEEDLRRSGAEKEGLVQDIQRLSREAEVSKASTLDANRRCGQLEEDLRRSGAEKEGHVHEIQRLSREAEIAKASSSDARRRCGQLQEDLRRSGAEKEEHVHEIQRLSREAEIAKASSSDVHRRCGQLQEDLRRSGAEKEQLVQDIQRFRREAEIAEELAASRVVEEEELTKLKSDNEALRREVEKLKEVVSGATKFDKNHYISLLFNAKQRASLAKHEATTAKKALNTMISRANDVIRTLKEGNGRLNRDVSRARVQAKKAHEKVKHLEEHIEELKELLDEQDDKLHDLGSDAKKRLEEEISLLKVNIKNYKYKVAQDARQMQGMRKSLEQQSQQVQDLGFKLAGANREAYDLGLRLANANKEIELLKQQRAPPDPWQQAAEEEAKRWQRNDQEKWGQVKWTSRHAYDRYQSRLANFKLYNFDQNQPLTFEAIPWPILLSPSTLKLEEICWDSVYEFVKAIRSYVPNHKVFLKEARIVFHPDQWSKQRILVSVPDAQLRAALESAGNTVSQALNSMS